MSAWICRLAIAIFGLAPAGCGAPQSDVSGVDFDATFPTFAKYLPQAQAGDPKYQNLLGFMSFFGEGVPVDRTQAHLWFHLASAQGYKPAQRNLAIMHQFGLGVPRDRAEARRYANGERFDDVARLLEEGRSRATFENARPGEETYATFCAGCHGLNGIAAYVRSPSFALGERMAKSDAALLRSISNGLGVMPGWGGKLPDSELNEILGFIRGLEAQYEAGIGQALRGAPQQFFLFGPMRRNQTAYQQGRE